MANEGITTEVEWALTDHLNSVTFVLDSTGGVLNAIAYDSFGNVTSQSDPDVDFRFLYTGREFDPETGLYQYRTRYYDALTGRFISEDSIGFDGGDYNLYRYVGNSPLIYVDPYGTFSIPGGGLLRSAANSIENFTQYLADRAVKSGIDRGVEVVLNSADSVAVGVAQTIPGFDIRQLREDLHGEGVNDNLNEVLVAAGTIGTVVLGGAALAQVSGLNTLAQGSKLAVDVPTFLQLQKFQNDFQVT